MKRNVFLLALCQALMMTGGALIIATAALVGHALAADKSLATLPLAVQTVATMLATIPASLLMKRIGRQAGFIVGTLLGIAGGALATYAVLAGSLMWFSAATFLMGLYFGFGGFYRFAAADAATADYRSTAISYVMAGGLVAAFVGPNLSHWTAEWLRSAQFAGGYLALVAVFTLSLLALFFVRLPRPSEQERLGHGRPLRAIARQPAFVVAVLAGMIGYGVMALVMTATPLAMHAHAHPFGDTVFVIEWHFVGMFAPSFFTGHLIKRFGVHNVMLTGAVAFIGCIAINLAGTTVPHFWAALFLLGIGWNFLFVGATTLLTETYAPEEKAKTQALNDFFLSGAVALAAFSAGALQHYFGWRTVNLGVIPLVVAMLAAIVWLKTREPAAAVLAPEKAHSDRVNPHGAGDV